MNKNELLKLIEEFMLKYGIRPSILGRKVMNDPNYVFDLRNGREPREKQAQRLLHFMENYEAIVSEGLREGK